MADGLNVVASRVDEEGPVVVGMIIRPDPRGTVVLGPGLESGGMEFIDRGSVFTRDESVKKKSPSILV